LFDEDLTTLSSIQSSTQLDDFDFKKKREEKKEKRSKERLF